MARGLHYHVKPPAGMPLDWGHPLVRDMVGCWVMNEGGGNCTNYASPDRPLAKLLATGVTWAPGATGGPGLKFTAGELRENASKALFDITDYLTVSALINTSQTATFGFIVGKSNTASSNGGYLLTVGTGFVNNGPAFTVNGGASIQIAKEAATFLDKWIHVCGVFNKDLSGNARVALYVDGIDQGTYTTSGTFTTILGNNSDVTIGTDDTGNFNFEGGIDHAMIWKRALSEFEARRLASNPWQIFQRPTHTQVSVAAEVLTRRRMVMGLGV